MLIELGVCTDIFCNLNLAMSEIKNHKITHPYPIQNYYA